jgi:hypothetical protein
MSLLLPLKEEHATALALRCELDLAAALVCRHDGSDKCAGDESVASPVH